MEKKIKILHILPSLTKGGAEKVCFDILMNLDRDKYIPSLLLFKDNGEGNVWKEELRNNGIIVTELKKRCLFDVINFIAIIRKIRKIKPDIVHTHLGGDIYGRLAATIIGIENIISTEHNINESESKVATYLKKITTAKAKKIFAVSNAVKTDSMARYNLDEEKVKVIYNGIDLNYFHKTRSEDSSSKQGNDEIGQRRNIVIGAMGRLTKQKGFSVLIDAIKYLNRNDIEVHIAGVGELKDELENKIKKFELEDRIKFVGLVEPRKFLETIDIFVFPSIWEGLGLVALEALAMEKPVIASRCNGITEVISDENGYLVAPNNPDQLSQTINNVINNLNAEEVKEKVLKGREVVLAKFSLNKMVSHYSFWYEKLYYKK